MNETTKSKLYWGPVEQQATQGCGIDIGCGPDPVTPATRRFDLEQGDANLITRFVKEQFDFVYSSHCLEHMHDARTTILEWWTLVKPGGYLFVLVPDEDLYEQGVFPSRFNSDHKATFTLCKAQSWSPKSVNVLDLARSLPGGEIVSLQLQDRGYDRRLLSFGQRRPCLFSRVTAKIYGLLARMVAESSLVPLRQLLAAYYPVDQTREPCNAQAQIQLIVKKDVAASSDAK
jgi:SAM-dependent methyltransferase